MEQLIGLKAPNGGSVLDSDGNAIKYQYTPYTRRNNW